MLSISTPQNCDVDVDGAVVPFSSSRERLGEDVGRRVGVFVWGTMGLIVSKGSSVAKGSFAQGVFGKQARPEGQSELNPLPKENFTSISAPTIKGIRIRRQRQIHTSDTADYTWMQHL